MKKLLLALPLLGLFNFNIYANGCPGQFDPQSGICRFQGHNGELVQYNIAPPQSGSSSPQKIIRHITVDVPSKYGAIAHNPKTGVAGGSIDMPSLQEAKQEAIKRCENGGENAPCKVSGWVRNGCIAAAKGKFGKRGVLFTVSAKRAGEVEQAAMNKCTAAGASGCKIYAPEGCSIPEGMNN